MPPLVESATDLDIFFDGFEEDVTLDPGGLNELLIQAIFSNAYEESLEVEGSAPMFRCKSSLLTNMEINSAVRRESNSALYFIVSIEPDVSESISSVRLRDQ